MPEAHAIDIEICSECPFISEHTRDDKTAQCTHPARGSWEVVAVYTFQAPSESCPIRHKLTVLRVTS